MKLKTKMQTRQRGFAVLSLVLMAVTLLAILGAVTSLARDTSEGPMQAWGTSASLAAQSNLLRSALETCASKTTLGTSAHAAYPSGSGIAITAAVCPLDNLNLLSGSTGTFLPPAPAGFNAWQYTNSMSGVVLTITASSAPSQTLKNAISNAANAIGSSAAVTMTNNSGDTLSITIVQ